MLNKNYEIRVNNIKKVHELRKQKTNEKIQAAIKYMNKNQIPINFNSLSKFANVSKQTLYNSEFKELIIDERNKIATHSKKENEITDSTKNKIIEMLQRKIEKLENENKELKKFIKNNNIGTKELDI